MVNSLRVFSINVLLLMDGTMFVGFPFIEERFSDPASRTTLSWVVTALFIFAVSSLLVVGRAADRFGRRHFLSGLLSMGLPDHGWKLARDWPDSRTPTPRIAIAMLSPSGLP